MGMIFELLTLKQPSAASLAFYSLAIINVFITHNSL